MLFVLCGLVAAGLILCLHVLSQPKITRDGRRLRKAPNTLPFVGNGILFLQPRQTLFSWFTKCERSFGYETLSISVPSLPPGVLISDPRNLDYVFRRSEVFEKGEFFKERSRDAFGHGIINVDGDLWRVQRKAGLHFLSASNLRVLTEVALPRYLRQSIGFLEERADGHTVVDLQAVFHEITTQLMGKMAYNMEMHADDDFTIAFDFASASTARRFKNPLWKLTEIPLGGAFRRALTVIKSHGRHIVSSAVRDRKNPQEQPSGDADSLDGVSGSLIQSLLDSIGDEALVADAALNYLTAGRDTTAQALTWAFYLLMKHPGALTQLRESLAPLQASSTSGDILQDAAALTPSNLPQVLAAFYETLRLYPPIPFEIKQAQQDAHLPDGTFLPNTSVVVWCTWAMNRSRITWGDDADDFRPGRWLSADGTSVVHKSAAEFSVFNGGPRLCLGKRMAEVIAVQVIAVMAARFDFAPAYEGDRTSKDSLTLPMEGGLPVYVKRR